MHFSKTARKDLLSIARLTTKYGGGVLSLAALLISGLTLYWAQHTIDDVRVIVIPADEDANLSLHDSNVFNVDARFDLIFINSGNRSVAITSIVLFIVNRSPLSGEECGSIPEPRPRSSPDSYPYYSIESKTEPFVIKPSEILLKTAIERTNDNQRLTGSGENLDTHYACLGIQGATPAATFATTIPWQSLREQARGDAEGEGKAIIRLLGASLTDGHKPVPLLH